MPFDIQQQVTLASGVQRICTLIGLPVPADAAGDSDPNIQQINAALNNAAAELYAIREWQELIKEFDLTVVGTAPGQAEISFPLPADWGRFVDQTQWASGQQWPAIGPVSQQGWMSYLVRDFVAGVSLFWQIREDQIWFLAPPFPTGAPFRSYYISRGYVQDQDDPTLFKDIASKNGDLFLLDGTLITLCGRMKWLEMKGFDTAAATRDFQIQYDSRAGTERGAPVLSLGRMMGAPLLNVGNIPDTGYGL